MNNLDALSCSYCPSKGWMSERSQGNTVRCSEHWGRIECMHGFYRTNNFEFKAVCTQGSKTDMN